jgi:AraC-like DNA-binding protein
MIMFCIILRVVWFCPGSAVNTFNYCITVIITAYSGFGNGEYGCSLYNMIATATLDRDMGRSTLGRKLKHTAGSSLREYVLQCRVTEARRRRSETKMPIKSITEKLAYETCLPVFPDSFIAICDRSLPYL